MSIERQNQFVNKSGDATEGQIVITGKYRELPNGTEILTGSYRMGAGEIVFIANLPRDLLPIDDVEEMEAAERARGLTPRPRDAAPVYFKFKIRRPGPDDEREPVNNPEDPTEVQVTVTGHLRPGKGKDGHETFVAVLRLGFFELVFIMNIPQVLYAEGDRYESDKPPDQASVYVKTKLRQPASHEDETPAREREDHEPRHTGHRVREPSPAPSKAERHAH